MQNLFGGFFEVSEDTHVEIEFSRTGLMGLGGGGQVVKPR
jgi:hypothetical protein